MERVVKYEDSMADLSDGCGSISGTENYYLHLTYPIVYTDGIKELVNKYKCGWILDVIGKKQAIKEVNSEVIQYWYVASKNGKASIWLDNDEENPAAIENIEESGLPDGFIYIVSTKDTLRGMDVMVTALPVEG